MSRSSFHSLIEVDLLKSPEIIMNENSKKIPVVKLKIGEIVPTLKRGHTVAEMNFFRNNYNNYCHYRAESPERQFPPINSANSSKLSQRDNTILFILKGMTRGKTGSAGTESRSSPSSAKNIGKLPLTRGNSSKMVKSYDSFGDASNNPMNGCEVKGNSLMKDNMPKSGHAGIPPKSGLPDYKQHKRSPIHGHVPQQSRSANITMGRPMQTTHAYQSHDYSAFERGEGYLDDALIMRTPPTRRKVHFDETRRPVTSISLNMMLPLSEEQLRVSDKPQAPLQLTRKNLEMFDYLAHTNNTLATELAGDKDANANRVMSWVQNTSPIPDIPEEGENETAGLGTGAGVGKNFQKFHKGSENMLSPDMNGTNGRVPSPRLLNLGGTRNPNGARSPSPYLRSTSPRINISDQKKLAQGLSMSASLDSNARNQLIAARNELREDT